jgi:bacterioferritin-associated ferredoxin
LYRDIARKEVAKDVREFEPAFALWSDGATKRRWLRMPPGAKIDTRDPDHWRFPAGTLFWKEFSREGRRLETRVIARFGADPRETWMGAFVWNGDESDARWVPEGQNNVRETTHDVPTQTQCGTCHGEPARVLGFSAVQQAGVDVRLLSDPVARTTPLGGDLRSAALGYLHANCGHCHNPAGSARPDTDLNLQLSAAELDAAETDLERSTLDRALQSFTGRGATFRIARGDADSSAVVVRMQPAEPSARMPPIGTERIDERGVGVVRAWIESFAR